MFKSEAARATVAGWYDRFLARVSVPTESRVVKTRFGDAHVRVGGPEDGKPLVLLHGAMASSAHALRELEGLLHHFRVYAVDVVGQSVKSADVRPSVKNDDYARWLAEVMDGLSLPRALVVGVSWGGFVCVRLAAFAPQRIERLALLVPAGIVSGPAFAGFMKMGWPMTKYMMAPNEARLRAFVAALLTSQDEEWVRFLGDSFLSYDVAGMKIPTLARDEELARFDAPTLVIGADKDLSFPGQKLIDRAKVLFKGLEATELVKDCNHCPPTTDEFRAWLSGRITSFMKAEAQVKRAS
jgi:pimeloyl-ACP methyl ester carboxylesterase